MNTLLVTNDFPPRQGGIQSFLYALATHPETQPAAVLTSPHEGDTALDAQLPFPVYRTQRYPLLPTPGVGRLCEKVMRENGCTRVVFGAAAPLGLLGKRLRSAGAERIIAITHGHEVWWASLPGARLLLRRIGHSADIVTYLGEYTRSRLQPMLGDVTQLARLAPGVDLQRYHPRVSGEAVRRRHGLEEKRVIVCVSRLVPRKGQDILIRALPEILAAADDVALLLVGDGPYRSHLEKLASRMGVREHVVFTGAVSAEELPEHYAAADVFAMPARTRRWGADVEGLGMVYLEASATGVPVIAGNSGGAPDAVRQGETGFVVDGRSIKQLAQRCIELLSEPDRARTMGAAGRAWVEEAWGWDSVARQLRALLDG